MNLALSATNSGKNRDKVCYMYNSSKGDGRGRRSQRATNFSAQRTSGRNALPNVRKVKNYSGFVGGRNTGFSETSRMPCFESSVMNSSASRSACSCSTSYSWQILAAIFDNGVCPSAACHIRVATPSSVKKVESAADIIIISPPSMRAAIASLFETYFSLNGTSPRQGFY